MSKVIVVGGGAAGMFAAIFAAKKGHEVHIIEKNEKFGKKIYITGKGRCNVTNDCDVEQLLNSVVRNHKFLYSAFYECTSQDVMTFFEEAGCPVTTQRGNRVFPTSEHASDIINALVRTMKKHGVITHLNTEVKELLTEEKNYEDNIIKRIVTGVRLGDNSVLEADSVIVATGGLSYPTTGSTGDGYNFAKCIGHKVTDLIQSLVPLETKEEYIKDLQGLSLRNVEVSIEYNKKEVFREFGEMLFTHFGVSGPLILSASSYLGEFLEKRRKKDRNFITADDFYSHVFSDSQIAMYIDLKPALSEEQLHQRVLREFDDAKNKAFKNILNGFFPGKLIPVIIQLLKIPEFKKINEITKEERTEFVQLMKHFPMTITGFRSFKEAVITKGGISVKEVNPSTMESKLCKGLFFCGEVLDLDALTGGFNLQIAWSTGCLAGRNIE